MTLFEPFTWLITGLIVAMGYAYLAVPREPHPSRCIGWGVALAAAGGLAGHSMALAAGLANPPLVAITLAACCAAIAMAVLAASRRRTRHF